MRRLAVVVLSVLMGCAAPDATAETHRLEKKPSGATRAKALRALTNGFLSVFLEDSTGQFWVRTGGNHPRPNVDVLFQDPSSYISFRDQTSRDVWVNASEYFPGTTGLGDYNLRTLYNAPASLSTTQLSNGFRTTYTLLNAQTGGTTWTLEQDVLIVGTTLTDSAVLHRVVVTNRSGATRNYGLRFMWDWQVAGNDASFFAPRGPDGSFTNVFTTYAPPPFQRYEEVDNPSAPTLSVFGTVSGTLSPVNPTQPSALRYAAWALAAGSAWEFTNSGQGDDSAVVYFWGANGELSLANNAAATYAQYITTQASAVGGGGRSSVSLGVNPSRIVQSGPVVLSFTPVNATGCQLSGGAPGTVIPGPQNNQATVQVTVGAGVRNDVFRVVCNGSSGQVSNFTVLSVGVPPPPPRQAVATLAAAPGGAAANGVSRNVALSDGGRFVAFESSASNLVSGDTNGQSDVFVRNTATGAITRASVANGGGQSSAFSGDAKISRDGRTVLFTQGSGPGSVAGEGAKLIANGQMCLNNLATNAVDCVSKNPNGTPGNGSSNNGAISGDGSRVVYESTATNLGPVDGNGPTSDVYVFDKSTNQTQIVSLTNTNAAATAGSFAPAISCNGRSIAFESLAALVNTAPTQPGVKNIYAAPATGGKRLVTVGTGNSAANGESSRPRITDDGRFVFFESSASNLVPGDTNGVKDVFVADLVANTIRRMSTSATGAQGNGESRNAVIPCDGAWLTFESDATNLIAGDTNGRSDVFIVNMGSSTVALASQAASGGAANGASTNGELSPDGTAIGFDSDAANVGASGTTNVFAGANPFATQNYTGAWFDPAQAGHGIFLDQLADGRLVAWWFTFDPNGAQAWFGGVGQIQGTTAVVAVVRTQGARFLPNFNPNDAVNTPIGTLTFNFTGCASGRVDFALDSEFGNGFMNLSRLTTPVGVSCGGATPASSVKSLGAGWPPAELLALRGAKAVENTVGPIAGITGAWYDPAQPGHGLFMENIGDGRLLVWWFAYGPTGGQAWFGNIATITSGTTASINFLRTAGGRWIPNFNAANVTNPVLGSATIVFSSCDAGVVNYNFGQGFGSGQMILRPLLRPAGTTCTN
jgi:hypothetical protein